MAQNDQDQAVKELSVVIAFLKRRLIYKYGPGIAFKWSPRQRTPNDYFDI